MKSSIKIVVVHYGCESTTVIFRATSPCVRLAQRHQPSYDRTTLDAVLAVQSNARVAEIGVRDDD